MMDAGNVDFAREMIAAFGEDRFYHAMLRGGMGVKREARIMFVALGGRTSDWPAQCDKLKLRRHGDDIAEHLDWEMDAEEARMILCRTAFAIAKHHKEYARKKPEMPASIHARMILDSQNEWTQRYAEVLEEFKR